MIAFGYALDNDVKHMSTVVLDEDRTMESRRLIEEFVNTQTFRVAGEAQNLSEFAAFLRRGKAYVGVQIPPDFTRELRAGRTAHVQVVIDGSSSTIALQALNTALSVTLRESMMDLMRESGRQSVPIEIRPQVLYNPAMRSPNFFVPGVIGVVLQIATTFATAMSIVRERERGTIEQLLVSPLSKWGLMLGKITPYLVIGMAMATGLFAIMRWLFDVPIVGNITALYISTLLYVFCLLSLGLLVSTRAQNQIQALQMSMVFIMPSVFFSGFIFPRETMPWIFQALGACLPTTYFIELERAIILRGASLEEFWPHLVVLAGMGVGLFALCALRFRRQIA
jgi:ABC-2 type transport system permease protein